jgi:hypothetical protein
MLTRGSLLYIAQRLALIVFTLIAVSFLAFMAGRAGVAGCERATSRPAASSDSVPSMPTRIMGYGSFQTILL